MDSGLGSDEDQRRSRTKEQKQRLNEQLIHGAHCFIDASLLQDDEETQNLEDRTHIVHVDERRQGALLFQTGINQYSTMLQLAGPSEIMPETPFNSISHVSSHLDENEIVDYSEQNGDISEEFTDSITNLTIEDEENATKPSLGFYVDLNDVQVNEPAPAESSSSTKNIFSMVIDFEAPKKDMPTHLFRNTNRRMSNGSKSKSSKTKDTQEISKGSPEKSLSEGSPNTVNSQVVPLRQEEETVENVPDHNNQLNNAENHSGNSERIVPEDTGKDAIPKKFVSLSDLMFQNTKVEPEIPATDIIAAPKMSRSIPESSWVESPLLMSRSAGFRIAPRPLEPDTSLSDSTGSQTGPSQRRLGTDLLRMFLEELDTDTVIHIGSKSIKAHRCILISRCQYFAGTLRGRSLHLDGFSYETVHFGLCHIYSGAAHVPDSINLVELASLADLLSLEGLKEVVSHALKIRHCHSFHSPCAGCLTGVLEVLPLTSAYGLDELYQKCLKWIHANYLRVWPSRAFAGLPKELREKCLQQHVVHMSPATVLTTNLTTDRLLASLPTLKWAEPVVQLATQLSHVCLNYVTLHFVAVLNELVDMEPWNYPKIEELLLNAAKGLSLDNECSAFARCYHLLQRHKTLNNVSLTELLDRLTAHFERRLVQKSNRLQRCPKWNNMDAALKTQVRSRSKAAADAATSQMTKSTELMNKQPASRLPRMIASQKTATTTGATSSSESSRNSSPATSQTHPSPSLRRSLLLAARSPQIPPSPNAARRVSTLTMPTAASAAKSASNQQRPIKQQQPLIGNSSNNNNNKSRATSAVGRKPQALKSVNTTTTTKRVSSAPVRRPVKATTNAAVKPMMDKSPAKRQNTGGKSAMKQPVTMKQSVEVVESPQKSPSMHRSSTFLKLEPTVLTKISSQDD